MSTLPNNEELDALEEEIKNGHEYSNRMRRLTLWIVLVAWLTLTLFVLFIGYVAYDTRRSTKQVRQYVTQSDCHDKVIAVLDTRWRTALDDVMLSSYRGTDIKEKIKELDKAANVNITNYIDKLC